jgi:CheY-like chemotaxis protein
MRRETVLVIDDDGDSAEICSTLLRHHGFEVLVADGPEAGVALARGSRPSVVVTELFGRTRYGWRVLDVLNSRAETAGVPVIVTSAHALPADRAAAAGAAVFLAKPVYPRHVLEQVRRYCAPPV